MIKGIIILVLLLIIFPLATRGQEKTFNVETKSIDPSVNKILNGPITKEGLQASLPYKSWFNTNYKTYLVDIGTLKKIKKKKLKDMKILVFMGTWCRDSVREIPRLIRVMEELGISDQLELYGIDVDRTSTLGFEKGYIIKNTPTIIVSIDGVEVRRIIEAPEVSFESELLNLSK
jgi:thiol-disulfide isomerase/thioredoxin